MTETQKRGPQESTGEKARRGSATSEKVRVLGIDPGTLTLGYGILDVERGGKPSLVDCGALKLPAKPLATRLEIIFRRVHELIEAHNPSVLALEEVFHGKNFQSVLKVGEARGVIVLAAEMLDLEICEYAPARIKKAATGNGNAGKPQVQTMMTRILELEEAPSPPDVTDALAVAFCHGQRMWRRSLVDGGAAPARRRSRVLAGRRAPKGKSREANEETANAKTLKALLKGGKTRVFLGSRNRTK
jgi:crossover junction endodeoxyribonuclease RuvC